MSSLLQSGSSGLFICAKPWWFPGLVCGFLAALAVPSRSVAQDDAVYVSQVDTQGAVTPFFTSATATLNGPSGLAFDASGNLYVSQFNAGIVTRITTGGVATDVATGLGSAWGLAVDGAGNLFVAGSQVGEFGAPPIIWKVAANGGSPSGFDAPQPFWTGTSSETSYQSVSHVAISGTSLFFSFNQNDFIDEQNVESAGIKVLGLDDPGGTPTDFNSPIPDVFIQPLTMGPSSDQFLFAAIGISSGSDPAASVWSFNSSGQGTLLINLETYSVWGLAYGPDNLVYATRANEDDVVRFDPLDPEAGYTIFASGFQGPDGIAFNDSTLFVANFSAVPEPATLMLVVSGVTALAVRGRGRRGNTRCGTCPAGL